MGKASKLLRREVEAHEAEVRATIGELDAEKLMEWCRTEIDNHKKLFDPRNWTLDPIEVIRRSVTQEDQEAALQLARKSHKWRADLIVFARQCRRDGVEVPELWRIFLRNVANGAEAKPDERGLDRKTVRDEAICRCIQYIANCTAFKATRNVANPRITSAADIVAAAEGISYYTVETIWKRYRKGLRDIDSL